MPVAVSGAGVTKPRTAQAAWSMAGPKSPGLLRTCSCVRLQPLSTCASAVMPRPPMLLPTTPRLRASAGNINKQATHYLSVEFCLLCSSAAKWQMPWSSMRLDDRSRLVSTRLLRSIVASLAAPSRVILLLHDENVDCDRECQTRPGPASAACSCGTDSPRWESARRR